MPIPWWPLLQWVNRCWRGSQLYVFSRESRSCWRSGSPWPITRRMLKVMREKARRRESPLTKEGAGVTATLTKDFTMGGAVYERYQGKTPSRPASQIFTVNRCSPLIFFFLKKGLLSFLLEIWDNRYWIPLGDMCFQLLSCEFQFQLFQLLSIKAVKS